MYWHLQKIEQRDFQGTNQKKVPVFKDFVLKMKNNLLQFLKKTKLG